MYAQLVEGGTTPELREEMDRIVREEMLPALAQEAGHAGALNLVNRDSGDAMAIVLWTTAEQALRPLSEYGPGFRRALSHLTGLTSETRPATSVWRVEARI